MSAITGAAGLIARVHTFAWKDWREDFGAAFTPVYRAGVQASVEADQARARVRKASDEDDDELLDFDPDDEFTEHFLSEYVGQRIRQLEGTTREDVIRIIKRIFDEPGDKSVARLQQDVLDAVHARFEDYEAYRALRIARTETGFAFNHGTGLLAKQNGVDVDITDGDDDEECAAANGATWTADEFLANPLEHPNAVMAGTRVLAIGDVRIGYRARWSGPALTIATAGSAEVTVGPNHPVLTDRGWIAAQHVREGDYVVRDAHTRDRTAQDYFDHVQPVVEQVFRTLVAVPGYARVVAAPAHLHGDGNFCQGEIDVVWSNRFLAREFQAASSQKTRDRVLVDADTELQSLARLCALDLSLERIFAAAARDVSCVGVRTVDVSWPNRNAALLQAIAQDRVRNAGAVRDLARRFPRHVALDQVIKIRDIDRLETHAFDLETDSHAYFANSIVVSNCTRDGAPHVDEDDDAE